ncbi:MAG: FHA domain-containing protein [Lachnospiraceae bacterium]|nr:FHA domain-containing protein [Lachnospiraceae bacterium]
MFTLEMQGTNTFFTYQVQESDKKDITTLNILKNNKIDGLLPFAYSQMNKDEFFRYNVTSKITLEKFLLEIITKEQILTIWITIINTIMELEEYMINGNTLLLNLDKIYVNVSTCKPELICMPLFNLKMADQEEFFKELIYKMRYSQEEDTSYVIKLIEYFNGSQPFSLIELKNLLENLNEKAISASSNKTDVKNVPQYPLSGDLNKKQYDVEIKPIVNTELNNNFESKLHTLSSIPEPELQRVVSVPNVSKDNIKEKKGFFWKKKKNSSKEKSKSKTKAMKGMSVSSNMEVPGQAVSANEYFLKQEDKKIPVKENQNRNAQVSTYGVDNYNMVAGTGFGETTVLSMEIGETTVLSQDMKNNVGISERTAYIIRKKNGDKRLIHKSEFKIGKETSYVDFSIEDNSNISRTHANIIQENGKLYIMDNNSTNHTYVDEKIVMPGEKIELFHTSKIRLADEEFEINYI